MPRGFFFLYPYPYSIRINEINVAVLERKPGFWKFLPWYLSLFLITGVLGIPSNAYVILKYTYNFRIYSTLNISLIQAMFSLAMGVFAGFEVATALLILCFPELLTEFNTLNVLESRCKVAKFVHLHKSLNK